MIRTLTVDDSNEYSIHLLKVKESKGIRAINNFHTSYISEEYEGVRDTLSSKNVMVWGEFNEDGQIVTSALTKRSEEGPVVYLENFKSQLTGIYNPRKSILSIASEIFNFFEKQQIWRYVLIRPKELFNSKRYPNIEDEFPLNRYNSYCDEIIYAQHRSKYKLYNRMLYDSVYDIDLLVITMSLKQQYRKYDNDVVILPLTKTKEN
jgi:hypothetical protein